MDSISELIEAGEDVLRRHRNQGCKTEENLPSKSKPRLSSLRDTYYGVTKDSDSGCFISDQTLVHANEVLNSISICNVSNSDIEKLLPDKNGEEKLTDIYPVEPQRGSSMSLLNLNPEMHFPNSHLQTLREECATIFSLSHFLNSSLINANRLLGYMSSSSSKSSSISSSSDNSLSEELSLCNTSCKNSEQRLNKSSQRMLELFNQLDENYHKGRELYNSLVQIQKKILLLLDLSKDLLLRNGLKHLLNEIQIKCSSPESLLEEVNLRLTLLTGELPSILYHEQAKQIEDSKRLQKRLEESFELMETELKAVQETKDEEIREKSLQLRKIQRKYDESQLELTNLQKMKDDVEENFKKQIIELEREKTTLSYRLNQAIDHEQEIKKSSMAMVEEKSCLLSALESEIAHLKSRIKELEQELNNQIKIRDEASSKFDSEKEEIIRQKDGLSSEIFTSKLENENLVEKIKSLELNCERLSNYNDKLKEEIETLILSAQKQKSEAAVDYLDLERKMDSKVEELCEKESKIRSLEVFSLELKTETDLEKEKSANLNAELDLLHKQVSRLQEKIKKLIHFCPREVRIMCGLYQDDTFDPSEEMQKVLDASQKRELQLKNIIEEKDKEMKRFQLLFSEEISRKNKELDTLTMSIENLEDQMTEIHSNVDLSSNMSSALNRTNERLSSRSNLLHNIQEQVKNLSLSSSRSSNEIDSEMVEGLKAELKEAKKNVKQAREDARKERVEAAKLKQQLALMKIDLESAQSRIKTCNYEMIRTKVPENEI